MGSYVCELYQWLTFESISRQMLAHEMSVPNVGVESCSTAGVLNPMANNGSYSLMSILCKQECFETVCALAGSVTTLFSYYLYYKIWLGG